jgi:flagella basal body P-ring formation protein FlgA
MNRKSLMMQTTRLGEGVPLATETTGAPSRSRIVFLLVLLQICGLPAGRAFGDDEISGIRVYLPREVMVKDNELTIGRVGIIHGQESLAAKADGIGLGRISAAGQKVVIDRATILSRLACSGVPASQVTLTGAEKVTVSWDCKVIRGDEFVESASSFLKEGVGGQSTCQFEPMHTPEDMVLPDGSADVQVSPHRTAGAPANQPKVEVVVSAGGVTVGTRQVTFKVKYSSRQAVTVAEIAAGEPITPANTKIETVSSNQPEPEKWSPPYGLVAKRRLPANTVIGPETAGVPAKEVVVERNQNVVIRIDAPGLVVTAAGRAMQQGKVGDFIKVRNVDSQRIIVAKVNEDASVEPVF